MLPEWHMHAIAQKNLHRMFSFLGWHFFFLSCFSHSLPSECEFMSVHFSNGKDKSTKLQDCTNARMKKYIWIIKALFHQRECVSHCHKNTALLMTNRHFFINYTSWTFIKHNATLQLLLFHSLTRFSSYFTACAEVTAFAMCALHGHRTQKLEFNFWRE